MLLVILQLPFSAMIHSRSLLLPDRYIGKTYRSGKKVGVRGKSDSEAKSYTAR